MKKGFYVLTILLAAFTVPVSIYDIQIRKLNGSLISMSEFTGKKIIIIPFTATNPEGRRLRYLDSLQNVDTTLQVIGVPATDFSGEATMGSLVALRNTLSGKFVMTRQSQVKKETTINQHRLFRWLTRVGENSHFDTDADSPCKLFIISKTGVLYSVLEKDVPPAVLLQALNQNINQ